MTSYWQPERKYVYLAADLITGTIRDEIPFSSLTFSNELNMAGGFSATCSISPTTIQNLSGDTVANRVTEANIGTGRTIIWVLRNETPVWGGIIWSWRADMNSRTLTVAGQDFFSYYWKRVIRSTLTYSAASDDQFEIVDGLIAHAEAPAFGNIGTTVSYPALSGRQRDRTYYWFERKPIAEAIQQLAGVNDGFDFAIDYGGTVATGLTHQLTLGYPRRGRASTGLIFDTRKNVTLLTWEKNGEDLANTVYAQGAGEGDNMVQTSTSDTSLLGSYPLLEAAFPHKDVLVHQTIVDHAERDLARVKNAVETLSVEVRPDDSETTIGTFITGDTVRVVADDGFIDIDSQYRVMGYSVSVNEEGRDNMTVNLASEEGTT